MCRKANLLQIEQLQSSAGTGGPGTEALNRTVPQ
jgi:hypothetical protein